MEGEDLEHSPKEVCVCVCVRWSTVSRKEEATMWQSGE